MGAPYPLTEQQALDVATSISSLTAPVNWTYRVQQPSSLDQLPVAPDAVIIGSPPAAPAGRRLLGRAGRGLLASPSPSPSSSDPCLTSPLYEAGDFAATSESPGPSPRLGCGAAVGAAASGGAAAPRAGARKRSRP